LKDLHLLPKVRDSLSFLYLEHGRIDQHEKAIAYHGDTGIVPVPVASLTLLMLGPGTDITHAAIRTLAENNCLVVWCGEQNVRLYAMGMGGTRSAAALLHQAALVSDPKRRLEVIKRMYEMRFGETLPDVLDLASVRGREGLRVRSAYARLSREYGVPWVGRSYDRQTWYASDPINRAISASNSCLYGVCHAAILSVGLSPALGFIHTGKQLSFVYDIADLYKVEVTLPVAFEAAAEGGGDLERRVRLRCRDMFQRARLLQRVVPDIQKLLGEDAPLEEVGFAGDEDPALPTPLASGDEVW